MKQQEVPKRSSPPTPTRPSTPPPPPPPPKEGDTITAGAGTVLTLDFTGVSTEFEPLPVGIYKAVVAELEYVASSEKSGQPYLKFVFEVKEEGYTGRKLFMNASLVPSALWKLGKVLNALGVEVPKEEFNLELAALVGLPCTLSVASREFQGKMRNDVTEVMAPQAGPTQPPFTG